MTLLSTVMIVVLNSNTCVLYSGLRMMVEHRLKSVNNGNKQYRMIHKNTTHIGNTSCQARTILAVSLNLRTSANLQLINHTFQDIG